VGLTQVFFLLRIVLNLFPTPYLSLLVLPLLQNVETLMLYSAFQRDG
jgi:hypothetical protein